MSKELKNKLLKYGIAALVGGLMAYSVTRSYNLAEALTDADRYRILSDAFTVPGVVLIMFGLLVMVANGGFFNGISYAGSYALKMLIPGASKNMERYGDYLERKSKRPKIGFAFLIIVGACYLAVAVVFIFLFYSVYNA